MKILLISLLATFTASAQIVFVDMANLVMRHPRTEADKAQLTKDYASLEEEIAKLQVELEAMKKDFEAAVQESQSPALSAAAKKTKEDVALDKRGRLIERDRQASEAVQLRRDQLAKQEEGYLTRTTDDIRNVIEVVSKKKGYKVVLPKAMAVYLEPGLDITAEIAREMALPELEEAAQ